MKQLRVSIVIQAILPAGSFAADVKIQVGKLQRSPPFFAQQFLVLLNGGVKALLEHLFGLGRRRPQLQTLSVAQSSVIVCKERHRSALSGWGAGNPFPTVFQTPTAKGYKETSGAWRPAHPL